MLFGIFVLLACLLAGDFAAQAFALPVPGPVIGILLLVAVLALWQLFPRFKSGQDSIEKAGDGLLAWLGLFFVPAGVGVAAHFDLVLANGLPLAITLIASTLLTLVVTVWVFVLVQKLTGKRDHAR